MDPLQKLIDEKAAVLGKIDALLAKAELTEDESAEHDRLVTEADAINAKIGRVKAQVERQKQADKEAADLAANPPSNRRTQPDSPANTHITAKLASEDDPQRGFKSHREFFKAVLDHSSGKRMDEKLKPLHQATAGSDEAGSYSDPYGGFLVPAGFSPNLLSVMAESDPIGALTTKIPMESPTVSIPARTDKTHTTSVSGGLRVYRRAEADTVGSSRQEFEQVVLNATSLMGIAYATEEILARSPISFIALLEAGFRDEFTAKLLDERLNGTGAGMMEGVINAPGTVSVAKETGQNAATITKENIDKMRARCWRYGDAVWLYNHDCLPQLRSLVQDVGTGGVPVSYFSVDANGNSTLDGRPAFATEFTKTLGTTGDLVLGVWSQYLEGMLTGMNQAESMHVRFVNHERTFKFWMENDGRCWWRSALTPRNSSATLSPFVKLDTRS